jgi:hypothetical protein
MDGIAQRLEEEAVSRRLLREVLLEGEVAAPIGIQCLIKTQFRATLESTRAGIIE